MDNVPWMETTLKIPKIVLLTVFVVMMCVIQLKVQYFVPMIVLVFVEMEFVSKTSSILTLVVIVILVVTEFVMCGKIPSIVLLIAVVSLLTLKVMLFVVITFVRILLKLIPLVIMTVRWSLLTCVEMEFVTIENGKLVQQIVFIPLAMLVPTSLIN